MKNLTILAYHRVCPEFRGALAVTPEQFEQHIISFLKKGYQIKNLKDIYELYFKQGQSIPKKTLVLTFDDGYQDNYTYAFPVIKKYKLSATIFLAVNYINQKKHFRWDLEDPDLANIQLDARDYPLTWPQIKEMHKYGLEFGSHTLDHPKLTKIPIHDAWQEIYQSRQDIEKELGTKVYSFCAPHGYLNSALTKLSEKAGYAVGVLNPPGIANQDLHLNETIYSLRRIGVYQHDNVNRLLLKQSFLFNIYRKIRSWLS
ncbi:MAG: polysaccharide deacetylase family protein [Candidatus Margulisbacteria bacterium]|nr:polysaccharide deacetylase family protein [Candidatus Margulisiibacteriota bacterium]